MLHSLYWLPIEQRIEYKLSCLCFKIISHQAPIYLSELLHLYTPSRQLRSATDTRVFIIPSFRTKSCGQRSFSYQAPLIWNQLPVSVRHSTSVSSFKSSLKTFLIVICMFPASRSAGRFFGGSWALLILFVLKKKKKKKRQRKTPAERLILRMRMKSMSEPCA